jgi:hypothetical protein
MESQSELGKPKTGKRSVSWWIRTIALAIALVMAFVVIFVIYHAESILKGRVIETLSTRFKGPVELSEFHVSVRNGFHVSGAGLKIFGPTDPNSHQPGVQPLIAIGEFHFAAGILNLLHTPMRINRVYLKGLILNIPPKEDRKGGFKGGKIKIYVDEFVCDQARLVINTLKPGKLPRI